MISIDKKGKIKKSRPLGVSAQRRIKECLSEALVTSKLHTANFNQLPPFNGALPKSEDEVNDFIKERIRLWINSWIGEPIQRAIDELNV